MSETADRIRDLAERGYTQSEMAVALGISRQRVHSVCAAQGIVPSQAIPAVIDDLIDRGWNAYKPVERGQGHDIVAGRGGRLITIEVLHASRDGRGRLVYAPAPDRMPTVRALVIEGEPIVYAPPLPTNS